MGKNSFTVGEFYHIYNRGVEKRNIFLDDNDRWRFLTLLLVLQGESFIPQVSRVIPFVKHLVFDKTTDIENYDIFTDVLSTRKVELVCFCMMQNHFHLILHEIKGGGISSFMQRLGDSYTKYFNIKRERSGHLFGGVFQSRHIDQNEYLTYLSAYIHMNPCEFKPWHNKESKYPWSSFQDYVDTNRWKAFLAPSIILDQFQQEEYRNFVKESNIKNILEDDYLID